MPTAISAAGRECRQSSATGAIRTIGTTALMTIAASTADGRSERRKTTGSRASTASPVIAPLQGVRAPACRLSALRENEPPIGKPPVSPAATLAAPWETNSRSALQGILSLAAKLRAIDAGSAKPTTAMMAPGTSNERASPHGRPSDTGGTPTSISPTRAPA